MRKVGFQRFNVYFYLAIKRFYLKKVINTRYSTLTLCYFSVRVNLKSCSGCSVHLFTVKYLAGVVKIMLQIVLHLGQIITQNVRVGVPLQFGVMETGKTKKYSREVRKISTNKTSLKEIKLRMVILETIFIFQ